LFNVDVVLFSAYGVQCGN